MVMIKRTAIALSTLTLLAPLAARAELPERKSPLADAPAVRHRAELRSGRFEIGPGVATTIGQDFYHAVMVGGKATFHLADWLAIGGMFMHNVTPNFQTAFREQLDTALAPPGKDKMPDRTPPLKVATSSMNKIAQTFAAQLELSPFSGKYSLFGKIFANYDFYGFGGVGFINFTSDAAAPCPAAETRTYSCGTAVTGLKPGATFGIGVHTFVNDFVSLNLEARDILLRNNPSGRDESGDMVADSQDLSWDSNYMVGLSITLFLPSTAHISE
jgi:outer membrane beta-barrel protein